jgi:hypothetical protein
MAEQDSTPSQHLDSESRHELTYEVLALRAKLRAVHALLVAIEGYGDRDETGEALCDIGFILTEADNDLDGIHARVDRLEGTLHQLKSENSPMEV